MWEAVDDLFRARPTAACPRRSTRSSTQSTATPTTLSMGVSARISAPMSVLDQIYKRYARSRRQAEAQREVLERQIGHFSGGVVPHIGRGSLDRNVVWRQADSSRAAAVAGLLICCERRRCGGDRDRGSARRQQWCDVLQFHSHGGSP